jgi:hypothetical protein
LAPESRTVLDTSGLNAEAFAVMGEIPFAKRITEKRLIKIFWTDVVFILLTFTLTFEE